MCIEGTRLCCPTAPPSMESPSKSPKEDSYFLVFKVAPNDHQGNPSRYNVKFIKGKLTQMGKEGKSEY